MEINRELLREIRKSRGLTQKDMAERLHCSITNYQQWETGKRNPKKSTIDRIAAVLGVPSIYIDSSPRTIKTLLSIYPPVIYEEEQKRKALFKELENHFFELNIEGEKKVIEYAIDLSGLPQYQNVTDEQIKTAIFTASNNEPTERSGAATDPAIEVTERGPYKAEKEEGLEEPRQNPNPSPGAL